MRTVTARLTGVTAYSQSKMVDKEVFPELNKEKPDDFDRRMWREKSTYDADGTICIPAMALKMAVDEAIKRLNIGIQGRGKSTYSKFFVAGQICNEDVPLGIHRDKVDGIEIWANSDGVRGSGKRVKRRFPIVHAGWSGIAHFSLLDDIIPAEVFERALIESGRLVGIGRFRPEKGGLLGRYAVEDFVWSES